MLIFTETDNVAMMSSVSLTDCEEWIISWYTTQLHITKSDWFKTMIITGHSLADLFKSVLVH